MKKLQNKVRFILNMLTISLIGAFLVACESNSMRGAWVSESGNIIYEFSGRNVTLTRLYNTDKSSGDVVLFSAYNQHMIQRIKYVFNGTFSLSDNQIEFTWTNAYRYSFDLVNIQFNVYDRNWTYFHRATLIDNGHRETLSVGIDVRNFSRTENTIAINDVRLT